MMDDISFNFVTTTEASRAREGGGGEFFAFGMKEKKTTHSQIKKQIK
jgi:hypothetical protein